MSARPLVIAGSGVGIAAAQQSPIGGHINPMDRRQKFVLTGEAGRIVRQKMRCLKEEAALKAGLKPMARLVSYGLAGVDPKIMGIGPVPAVQNALKRAGLKVEDMAVIESNEAFAVQALAVSCDLKFDPKKTNPNGGAVGLGHPIGATGALLTVKAIYELQRTGGRYALVTMCIGGGQGIAAVFERM